MERKKKTKKMFSESGEHSWSGKIADFSARAEKWENRAVNFFWFFYITHKCSGHVGRSEHFERREPFLVLFKGEGRVIY